MAEGHERGRKPAERAEANPLPIIEVGIGSNEPRERAIQGGPAEHPCGAVAQLEGDEPLFSPQVS